MLHKPTIGRATTAGQLATRHRVKRAVPATALFAAAVVVAAAVAVANRAENPTETLAAGTSSPTSTSVNATPTSTTSSPPSTAAVENASVTTPSSVPPTSRQWVAPPTTEPRPQLANATSLDEPGLYVIRPDGTGLSKLAADGAIKPWGPKFSPDGTRVAFFSRDGLDVVNADGSGRRTLVAGAMTMLLPSWSPDSTRLAFLGAEADGHHLRLVNVLDGATSTLAPEVADVLGFDWSPDGMTIAFLGNGGVNTVRADGTGLHRLVDEPAATRPIRWSPQGDKLAFGWSGRGPRQLWVVHADGSQKRSLGETDSASHAIDWSPDGTEVAVYAGMRTYLVSADGTNRRWLVDQSWFASWSPDGRRLAIQMLGPTIEAPDGTKRSTLQLVVVDSAGVLQTGLVDDRDSAQPLRQDHDWSPRGDLIAFTATYSRPEAIQSSWNSTAPTSR